MTSRELVRRTLEFAAPARVPRHLWLLSWATDHYPDQVRAIQAQFPDDIITAPGFYRKPPQTSGDQYAVGTYIDEWGCMFENLHPGVIGEVKQPLLPDWQDVDRVRVPDELLSVDVSQVNAFCRNTHKFALAGCCPRPFERLQFIRKSENLFVDLVDQPEELFALLNRVHQFYLKKMELWANTDVDALTFMDDWGAQRSLLISPVLWRKLFKPLYKDYIDVAHSHGKYAFMHSDGYTLDIIPDLIELGLDALNTQIFCIGVETLGERFRGKLTFWGEIDRQHLLSFATTAEVADAVRQAKEALYAEGGVIAQCEFGPGAKPENVYTVFKTWEDLTP
jgi:hypothetical protein